MSLQVAQRKKPNIPLWKHCAPNTNLQLANVGGSPRGKHFRCAPGRCTQVYASNAAFISISAFILHRLPRLKLHIGVANLKLDFAIPAEALRAPNAAIRVSQLFGKQYTPALRSDFVASCAYRIANTSGQEEAAVLGTTPMLGTGCCDSNLLPFSMFDRDVTQVRWRLLAHWKRRS